LHDVIAAQRSARKGKPCRSRTVNPQFTSLVV